MSKYDHQIQTISFTEVANFSISICLLYLHRRPLMGVIRKLTLREERLKPFAPMLLM